MALVLVASPHEPLVHHVAGKLEASGTTVLPATSGDEAVEAVRHAHPDAILVDAALHESVQLCSRLRQEPHVGPHTAILVTGGPAPRDARLAALRAGAWDILDQPLDIEELLLKLETFAQRKTLAERTESSSLVDPETGLYNLQGVARHLDQLGALAVRARAALACVVLAPELVDDAARPEVTAFCAQTIRRGVRHSDVSGRVAAAEFAVVAPATGAQGAIRLAQRLAGEMRRRSQEAAGSVPSFRLRAGYDAVGNLAYAPVSARDLLVRARRASLDADVDSRLGWIRPFEG
ncbi:MAG TPA: response regulator [Gemmatimonadales bacterium]|jgi:PleD family two-component response regulator|nr:response regulator [Gemmatimonadales bacterium]